MTHWNKSIYFKGNPYFYLDSVSESENGAYFSLVKDDTEKLRGCLRPKNIYVRTTYIYVYALQYEKVKVKW